LALGLTTFFQDAPDHVWLFDKSGVRSLSSEMLWVEIRGLSEDHTAWALVDSNKAVEDPAPVLYSLESPFFIVEAASPRKHRRTWVKYHGNTRFFYTNPFSLEEILRGAYIHLLCKIMSSHSHRMQGIWFNPAHPTKPTYETSSSSMVHLPVNVMAQPPLKATSNHILSTLIKLSHR
jgi:hypothetical protein